MSRLDEMIIASRDDHRTRSPFRVRNRPGRRQQNPTRRKIRFEQLEDRTTPSLLSTFELDANVQTGVLGTTGSTTTSHDWDQVFANNGTSGALATAFVTDKVNSNTDDIFTGGGSKDTRGIQSGPWLFTPSKPQAKNDITDAYAAAYTDPSNGHLLLFVGLDRFDNSGDATAGFWFFGNKVGEAAGSGTQPFIGKHKDGDILLVSDFTQGGSTSTIKVFRWTGDDATGSLQAVADVPNSTFATVNGGPTSVPWSFTNKSGETSPAHGEFFEGGVDLTALGLHGCFTAFLAETRSSQSPTATLSDFVLGDFPLCSIEAGAGSTGLSKVGDPSFYSLSVTNSGAFPIFPQTVSDTVLGNIVVNGVPQAPDGTVITNINYDPQHVLQADGSLAPGATLIIQVTRTIQAGDPDPVVSLTTYTFNDDADFSGDQMTATTDASAPNSINLFQPSATLDVTVSSDTADHLGQVITYTYKVTNTSSSDSPDLVLGTANSSFTDSLLGDLQADAMAAGADDLALGESVTFTETRAIQAGDPTPLVDNAAVAFTLAQNLGDFTNIIHASDSASVTLLPHLNIVKAVTSGFNNLIHPGDTASFTISVSNDGAGPATNVLVTDQLPEADLLAWTIFSSTFDTTSLSPDDLLTASSPSLPAGATASVRVDALIPADIFGLPPGSGGGTGNLPNGPFELDGNAIDDPGVSGDDWSNAVFGDGGASFAHSFATDAVNTTSDDIFTAGGSKDTLGIQQGQWKFTDSKPQAKNDITHAYASMYIDPSNGHTILYSGLDRFDNSGDATAGFWFFTHPVGLSTNNPTSSGSPFVGTHTDGDILLVSDFTVGGSVSTVQVYRWTGDDATGSLVPVTASTGTTFAVVNGGPIAVPWSFLDKSHNTSPAHGEFLEEGVDLTALGLGGCFSNFMAETRSSQSPTATLSDFVIGSFNTCTLPLPNTATVQADGIPPITSNSVLITVTDGHDAGGAHVRAMVSAPMFMSEAPPQKVIHHQPTALHRPKVTHKRLMTVDQARAVGISGEVWMDWSATGGWNTHVVSPLGL